MRTHTKQNQTKSKCYFGWSFGGLVMEGSRNTRWTFGRARLSRSIDTPLLYDKDWSTHSNAMHKIRFPAKSTKRLIEATLIKHLTKVKYDFELVPELTKTVANDLLFQIKREFLAVFVMSCYSDTLR